MVTDSGKSPRAIARDLGLTPSAVAGWVKQADVDAKGKRNDGVLTTEERAELGRLRKENKDLRMEREFLKNHPMARHHLLNEKLPVIHQA
jgi:transposase